MINKYYHYKYTGKHTKPPNIQTEYVLVVDFVLCPSQIEKLDGINFSLFCYFCNKIRFSSQNTFKFSSSPKPNSSH